VLVLIDADFGPTVATLGQHHQTVATAQDAARALRPFAGPAAADLFAIGLVLVALGRPGRSAHAVGG
jgi:Mn2+/Fe2+ NRAMP family transporter